MRERRREGGMKEERERGRGRRREIGRDAGRCKNRNSEIQGGWKKITLIIKVTIIYG